MSGPNVYFTQGTRNEQILVEDLIIESLRIYGKELFYIPRILVSKDEILGEDRLSEFKNLYPIEMYFENVDSFDGQGAFLQKFGLMMEQSATLVVSRRRWDQLIGRYGVTTIPTRPNEGDLLYFPLTGGLFEIKFVKHQDPFYQLGKLYVYKLQVELFQYSSERIDTGIEEVDAFEGLKTFSTDVTRTSTGGITEVEVLTGGSNYTTAEVAFNSTIGYGAEAEVTIVAGAVTKVEITNTGIGYSLADYVQVSIIGDGEGATAHVVSVRSNIDKVESYGDNNKFKREARDLLFNENNPFGD